MTEKITYIAFDGTEFGNSYDCEQYEKSETRKGIFTFDYERFTDSPLHAEHFGGDILALNMGIEVGECNCIYIADEDSYDKFSAEYVSDGLNLKMLSFFDVDENCWLGIDDLIDTYKSALTVLENIKKTFEIEYLPNIKG